MCDDGIGARVARILLSLPLPAGVTVTTVQRLRIDLLDELATADRLIVVDALSTGEEPGTCTVADVTEIPAAIASSECVHNTSVCHIIEVARHILCDGDTYRVAIAGIEGKQSLVYGSEFSDEVVAAIPRLVDLLLLTLGARVETRAMVKEACQRFSQRDSDLPETWYVSEIGAGFAGM